MPFFVHYAAKNGYHCIWLDLEHRAMGQREVAALLQLAMHEDIDIMLRPPHTAERSKLARYLEDGATGLMIPMQNTPEDVTAIVNKAKFPPLGDRGIDGADAAASFGSFCWGEGEHSLENWIKDTNRETFVCVQIETREALSNVDAITKVPGLDFVFVGPGTCAASCTMTVPHTPYIASYAITPPTPPRPPYV
jgi:2-keto-3-deoxy-L-rhamnonate aldolase RhmA